MITKCLIHTGAVTDSYTFTQNIRFIRAEAVPEYSPHNKDNSAHGCNTRFSTEKATKRQNLRTAALKRVKQKSYMMHAKIPFLCITRDSINCTIMQT